jgi:hypothetical protein
MVNADKAGLFEEGTRGRSSANSARGRIGAFSKWARTEDRTLATAPARRAFLRRFEIEVDPDGRLSSEERAKRADFAMRAHMARLSQRGIQARRPKQRQVQA